MPEIHAASIPPPAPFFPFDGDGGGGDDDFGDFEFAPCASLPLPSPILVSPSSTGSHPIPASADEDDWGDFVSSPLGSRSVPPFPDPIRGDAAEQPTPPHTPWEKPRGPLPLSIFGEAELVETQTLDSTPFFGNGFSTSPAPGPTIGESGPGILKNLIANLYDQSDPKRSPESAREENGVDDGSWEFMIASSHEQVEEDGIRGDRHDQAATGIGVEAVPNGMEYGTTDHHLNTNGDGKDLIYGNVQDDMLLTMSTSYSVAAIHKDLHSNMDRLECNGNGAHAIVSDADNCVDEEPWGFKDAFSKDEVVAAFPVEQKIPDTGAGVLTLATGVKAVEDISSAPDHYQYSSTILRILNLASTKEQHAYIVAWSSILVACAHELQHGAMIWQESVRANVCDQILSQGYGYFVALGEIYRLVKTLKLSVKCFEPWVLSDMGTSSGMLASLEKCTEAWNAGLENALRRTCDCHIEQAATTKALLDSIQRNNDVDTLFLKNRAPNTEEKLCKLSLLPVSSVQDMKAVVWNSDHYFVKLANFWAHRISCDPPRLPCIHLG